MTSLSSCLKTVPLCGSNVEYNTKLFFTTNESNHEETLGKLARNPIVGDTAIGVSGSFILNAVAERGTRSTLSGKKIEHIIVVDCSPRVEFFWKFMTSLLKTPGLTREEAILAILDELAAHKDLYWPNNTEESLAFYRSEFLTEIARGTSFLSSDEKFETIQKIAQKHNLVFKRVDMFSPSSFTVISQSLSAHHHTVDMVYVSNVSEFVQTGTHKSGFLESVRRVTDVATLLIASKSDEDGISQRVMRRRQGQEVPADTFSYAYTPHTH